MTQGPRATSMLQELERGHGPKKKNGATWEDFLDRKEKETKEKCNILSNFIFEFSD